jgi:hypothetical protein
MLHRLPRQASATTLATRKQTPDLEERNPLAQVYIERPMNLTVVFDRRVPEQREARHYFRGAA